MNEYVKAIKVIHQLLILASSAVLAFALTPNIAVKYQKADAVLSFLQNTSTDSWNDFVRQLQIAQETSESQSLQGIVRTIDATASDQLRFIPFAYGDLRYPLNGTLLDSIHYIEREQKLQIPSIVFDRVTLKKQWELAVAPPAPPQPIAIPPSSNAPTQPYSRVRPKIVNVTLNPPEGSWGGNAFEKVRLNLIEGETADRTTRILIQLDPASTPRPLGTNNTITLYTSSTLGPIQHDYYARNWLVSVDREKILNYAPGKHTTLFRDLEPFMGEISGLDVSAARLKLQTDKEAQHGRLSLFGLSVDADSTVDVMPWITSGILVFFISHLRQFRISVTRLQLDAPPWVGFFDDWAGQFVTAATILVLPLLANLLLVIRHGQDQRIDIKVVSLAFVGIFSIWTYTELVMSRSKLKR